jgi:SNF2 family DNA or RNA helicase
MQNFQYRYNLFLEHSGFKYQAHQEEGMLWCAQQETEKKPFQNIHGGIIADEMGCGKTFMMISLIVCNFVPQTLIVAPLALVNQWKQSIFETTGHEPLIYYGHKIKTSQERLHSAPVVITTYGVVSHKSDKDDGLFQINWDRIIYDEAHHMRSRGTKKYVSGKKLKANAKWLVTGTPIQNAMKDLYALCEIIGVKEPKRLEPNELHQILLKRTKESVGICLPPVIVHVSSIPWANEDEKTVATILHKLTNPHEEGTDVKDKDDERSFKRSNKSLSSESDGKGGCRNHVDYIDDDVTPMKSVPTYCQFAESKTEPKAYKQESMLPQELKKDVSVKLKAYIHNMLGKYYLSYYLRSRQMCICPKLLSKLETNFCKSELYDSSIISNAFANQHKIQEVVSLLSSHANNGNKKIVFCSFRKEMDILKQELNDAGVHDVAIYDGRMTRKQRSNILQKKPDVLILQIQMGCEGLNLQYANEVYFVGPLWNPATEDQAVARCYRLGQRKTTHVFKFKMMDIDRKNDVYSMDNYMEEKMRMKKELRSVLDVC